MSFVPNHKAAERAHWTAQAATVLHQQASIIARTCAEIEEDAIVVAVVEPDLSFGGVRAIPREELHEHILQVEDNEGKWGITFAPMTPVEIVEQRCTGIARLAHKRGEVIQRWLNQHS